MRRVLFTCAMCLTLNALSPAVWAEPEPAAVNGSRKVHTLHRRGGWTTDGGHRAMHRWSLQLTRGDDDSISGRVTLSGSPLASAGNVHGQIKGDAVFGIITDDGGREFAGFEGTVTATGMSGKYMDRTGETGDWASDALPPGK